MYVCPRRLETNSSHLALRISYEDIKYSILSNAFVTYWNEYRSFFFKVKNFFPEGLGNQKLTVQRDKEHGHLNNDSVSGMVGFSWLVVWEQVVYLAPFWAHIHAVAFPNIAFLLNSVIGFLFLLVPISAPRLLLLSNFFCLSEKVETLSGGSRKERLVYYGNKHMSHVCLSNHTVFLCF